MENNKIKFKLDLQVEKTTEDIIFSLILSSNDTANIEIFRTSSKVGEAKDDAFQELLYQVMRLDAFYNIPVSTQINILYHMVIEESFTEEVL